MTSPKTAELPGLLGTLTLQFVAVNQFPSPSWFHWSRSGTNVRRNREDGSHAMLAAMAGGAVELALNKRKSHRAGKMLGAKPVELLIAGPIRIHLKD
jgi:hypothetical protein